MSGKDAILNAASQTAGDNKDSEQFADKKANDEATKKWMDEVYGIKHKENKGTNLQQQLQDKLQDLANLQEKGATLGELIERKLSSDPKPDEGNEANKDNKDSQDNNDAMEAPRPRF